MVEDREVPRFIETAAGGEFVMRIQLAALPPPPPLTTRPHSASSSSYTVRLDQSPGHMQEICQPPAPKGTILGPNRVSKSTVVSPPHTGAEPTEASEETPTALTPRARVDHMEALEETPAALTPRAGVDHMEFIEESLASRAGGPRNSLLIYRYQWRR